MLDVLNEYCLGTVLDVCPFSPDIPLGRLRYISRLGISCRFFCGGYRRMCENRK